MSPRARSSRPHLWLEGLGDWRWPGSGEAAADFRLPSWIPAVPEPPEPAMAGATGGSVAWRAARPSPARRLGLGFLFSALAAAFVALLLAHPHWIEGLGLGAGRQAVAIQPSALADPPDLQPALPLLSPVHSEPSGSVVERARFASASLNGPGSFFVYLPPGYSTSALRYPVLYLLHGRNGHAEAFLEMGIQASLDGLAAQRVIAPMIVVMAQDAHGPGNWRDRGRRWSATYLVETQELVDRMFRTIPARSGRAIAGSSMGGFGAMNVALTYPLRFAVEESWLGFFDGLEGALAADRDVISRLGLRALLYGAEEDPVAIPTEDPEFAAALRAVGAQAHGVVYPGGHSLEKIREYLDLGIAFAGRSLAAAQRREAAEARAAACAQRVGAPGCPLASRTAN